jgi:hypothetical protein
MKITRLVALSLTLFASACAGSRTAATGGSTALSGVGLTQTCALARRYPDPQISVITRMRDDGDGLNDVARRVGGTRFDVRCVELNAQLRRHGRGSSERASEHLVAAH